MRPLTGKKKILFYCVITFCLVYLLISSIISTQMNNIVRASNRSLGEENTYQNLISDKDFKRLCYRREPASEMEKNPNIKEKKLRSPVFTFHWFTGAKSVHFYSYEIYDWSVSRDDPVRGSWNMPVTITSKLQNGKWVVTEVFEAP